MENKEEGSLYDFLNRWSTSFGSRMLRKWVWSPLLWEDQLKDRLDSVEYLVNNYSTVQMFKKELRGTVDLERWLSRWYKLGVETESRALYVTVNLTNRLNHFFVLLSELTKLIDKIPKIFKDKKNLPARLKALTTFKSSNPTNKSRNSKKATEMKN